MILSRHARRYSAAITVGILIGIALGFVVWAGIITFNGGL